MTATMARVTEASVNDRRSRRPAASRQGPLPVRAIAGRATSLTPVVSLALLLGGAGAILAPDPLPFPAVVLAIGAVALGGYLGGRRPAGLDVAPSDYLNGLTRATYAERQEVIRAALAVASISHDDDGAGAARRGRAVAAAVEPDEDGGDDGEAGRPDLRAIPRHTAAYNESLDAAADSDALIGAAP